MKRPIIQSSIDVESLEMTADPPGSMTPENSSPTNGHLGPALVRPAQDAKRGILYTIERLLIPILSCRVSETPGTTWRSIASGHTAARSGYREKFRQCIVTGMSGPAASVEL
jgi:hypothetical protein